MYVKYWPENLKAADNFGYLDIDGKIILKSILETWGETM
jgi:hypothetical protein